jgi:hypothetical protein
MHRDPRDPARAMRRDPGDPMPEKITWEITNAG